MPIKYAVELTQEERYQLLNSTKKGKNSSCVFKRSQILLLADQGYQDEAIAQMLMVGATAHWTRQRYVEEGVSLALTERKRPGRPQKLTSQAEAFLIATACSDPPEGHNCWTMQMLAQQLVTLEKVESMSDETVRTTLKKPELNLGLNSTSVLDK